MIQIQNQFNCQQSKGTSMTIDNLDLLLSPIFIVATQSVK